MELRLFVFACQEVGFDRDTLYNGTRHYMLWCVCYSLLRPKSEFADVVYSSFAKVGALFRSHLEVTVCADVVVGEWLHLYMHLHNKLVPQIQK